VASESDGDVSFAFSPFSGCCPFPGLSHHTTCTMRAPNDGGEISCMFDVQNVCSSFQPRPLCFFRGQATPRGEDRVLASRSRTQGLPLVYESFPIFSHKFFILRKGRYIYSSTKDYFGVDTLGICLWSFLWMLPATFHDHAAREGRDVMKRSSHVSHIERAPTSTNSIITLCFTYVIEAFSTIHEILLNVP